jgi:hypothetical protein
MFGPFYRRAMLECLDDLDNLIAEAEQGVDAEPAVDNQQSLETRLAELMAARTGLRAMTAAQHVEEPAWHWPLPDWLYYASLRRALIWLLMHRWLVRKACGYEAPVLCEASWTISEMLMEQ